MTPEGKAEELYWKYYQEVADSLYPENKSKECALIAVNELVYQWILIDTYLGDGQGLLHPNLKYWQEVKKELEKL